jgi:hypothetical protein
MTCLAARSVRVDLSWWRALELAADSREASPRQCAREPSTSHVGLVPPLGAGCDVMHGGRGSQPEERHGMVTEVYMIDRRRKNRVWRVSD